jgi:hypothetical protein
MVLALYACSSRQPEANAAVAAAVAEPHPAPTYTPPPPPPPTPPPAPEVRIVKGEAPTPSPMALMMRQMADFADSTRGRLAQGKDLLPFPGHFKQLREQEPTPGMVDHKTFDPYAQAWLIHLDRLYTVPAKERTEVFNTLVVTCAACHSTMCPGPLVRINKMKLPEQ